MKKIWEYIKRVWAFVGTDGLLHALVCYAMMLTLTPIVGIWWSIAITVIAALGKEAYDILKDDAYTDDMVLHDLVCDGVGVIAALLVIAIV